MNETRSRARAKRPPPLVVVTFVPITAISQKRPPAFFSSSLFFFSTQTKSHIFPPRLSRPPAFSALRDARKYGERARETERHCSRARRNHPPGPSSSVEEGRETEKDDGAIVAIVIAPTACAFHVSEAARHYARAGKFNVNRGGALMSLVTGDN